MEWIALTLLAAFSQAWRNALQSELSQHVSVSGVTLARFLVAGPIAGGYLLSLYVINESVVVVPRGAALKFMVGAACCQILATALMVILFKQHNYAVGVGLAKSEAVVAAVLGTLFFGSSLALLGWVGVLVGGIAVLMLSGFSVKGLQVKTALLGLACGTAFAVTSLWVREAALASGLPFPFAAAWVLAGVIGLQTCLLSGYISIAERETWQGLWAHRGCVTCVGVASCVGSIGWFSAMSLQHVAYVKTLGQLEIFFMMMISVLWLKKPIQRADFLGLLLIAIAAVLVMLT